MEVKTTPKKKTSAAKSEEKPDPSTVELKSMFISAALNMGWQLAVVVIIPIVGGYYLDRHFNTSPILEISGFILAAAGFLVVLRRQLQDLDEINKIGSKKK